MINLLTGQLLASKKPFLNVHPIVDRTYRGLDDGIVGCEINIDPDPEHPLNRAGLRYRMSGDSGFFAHIEVQVDGSNSLRYGRLDAGVEANVVTVTDVGTVTELRVVLDGERHEIMTFDGTNWRGRGIVTSSQYVTQKSVSTNSASVTRLYTISEITSLSDLSTGGFTPLTSELTLEAGVALPAVPTALMHIGVVYRVIDADNFWFAGYQYNPNTETWDFHSYRMVAGAPTTQITVPGVAGDAIRVVLSGTSHVISARVGGSWVQQASFSSSVHQGGVQVGGHYTGAVETYVDEMFDNWSGGVPVGWEQFNTGVQYTEVGSGQGFGGGGTGALNVYVSSTLAENNTLRTIIAAPDGTWLLYVIDVSHNSGTDRIFAGDAAGALDVTIPGGATGVFAVRHFSLVNTGLFNIGFVRVGDDDVNATIDRALAARLGPLDDSGDGGVNSIRKVS